MSARNRKYGLESILRSLGFSEDDFRVTFLGGDLSMNDRVEVEILDETFDGAYDDIHNALVRAENARHLMKLLRPRGLAGRTPDDG
jgi:hypothetical protein